MDVAGRVLLGEKILGRGARGEGGGAALVLHARLADYGKRRRCISPSLLLVPRLEPKPGAKRPELIGGEVRRGGKRSGFSPDWSVADFKNRAPVEAKPSILKIKVQGEAQSIVNMHGWGFSAPKASADAPRRPQDHNLS